MAGVLAHNLAVRNPDTLEATVLLAGTEVPDWASDLVDKGNLTDGKADSGDKGYAGQSADELKAEVEKRELEVTGTGANGNVVKGDLVAALEADDADNA